MATREQREAIARGLEEANRLEKDLDRRDLARDANQIDAMVRTMEHRAGGPAA